MICILLIGVNHNDPFGQMKVQQALQLAKEKEFVPDSIAVEWSSDHAKAIIAQRGKFVKLLQERLSGISAADLDILEQSLAFEADAHMKVYPDLPVLWLDQGRIADPAIIEEYAGDRAAIIYAAAGNGLFSIMHLSYEVMQKGRPAIIPSNRDDKFTRIIDDAVRTGHENIACIVGENHTDFAIKGMFGQQLIQKGYEVIRYITTVDHPIWEVPSFMSI